MSEALKQVVAKIAELKHRIKILQQLAELSGRSYENEINQLLDQLNWWIKVEKEVRNKK